MHFLQWAIKVNQLLDEQGYDCLFNEEEIQEMEQGETEIRTFFQEDAEKAFREGLTPQNFVMEHI